MKLVVGADLHINEDRRFQDTANLLQYTLEQVSRIHPDYLVILGDIFDKRRPTPREMRLLNKWLMAVKESVYDGIILLEGNHDLDRDVSALSYLQDLVIDKVLVVRPPYKLNSFYFDHAQVIGAQADSGFTMDEGQSLATIIENNPDCHTFAFGHLHKPQVLNVKPLAFYAGSLDKISFAEAEDIKRLWVFNDAVIADSIRLPTRPMYQFNITVTEATTGLPSWGNLDLTGAMLKVVFSGTREALKGVDSAAFHKCLYSRGIFSLKIAFDVMDKSVARNEIINESVSEKAALDEYFKDHANKDTMVTHGLQIIKESSNG